MLTLILSVVAAMAVCGLGIALVRQLRDHGSYYAGRRDQLAGRIDRRRSGAYVRGVVDGILSDARR